MQAGTRRAHISSCESLGPERPPAAPTALRMRPGPPDHPPTDPLLHLTSPGEQALADPSGWGDVLGKCSEPSRTASCVLSWQASPGGLQAAGSGAGPTRPLLPRARLSFHAASEGVSHRSSGRDSPGRISRCVERAPNVQLGDSRHQRGGARCGFRERLVVCWGLSLSSPQPSSVCPSGQGGRGSPLDPGALLMPAHPTPVVASWAPLPPQGFCTCCAPSPEPSPGPWPLSATLSSRGVHFCGFVGAPCPCPPPHPRLSCLQAGRRCVGWRVCSPRGTQSGDSCLVLGCVPVPGADLAHRGVVPAPRKSLVLALGAGKA